MVEIQEAVARWLTGQSGIRAVPAPAPAQVYPLLAVEVQLEGSTPLDGGRQCEERFAVTVTAASDRDREACRALLGTLARALPGGIPMDDRVLHPQAITARGDTLCFALTLCRVRPTAGTGAVQWMERLHFDV